tara:strand:+ start:1038 stop:1634 length:597 start_codon:yes stop_codon:yes gene_type:complete
MSSIGIFNDGTWMTEKDRTSIYHMYRGFEGKKLYLPGPGTGVLFDKWFGGAFGSGTHAIRNKACRWLLKNWDGEDVAIFGYSRGATAARMEAAKINEDHPDIKIVFLGCFDTVGAMGIPINILGIPFQEINLFTDMVVSDSVLRAAHALAKDEKRDAYVATHMRAREGIVEKYFDGDHSNIGISPEARQWMLDQYHNG